MGKYNFDLDLPKAKKTEEEVGSLLSVLYKAKILKYEDSYRYDILVSINEKNYKFEVKEDFMCWKTGNIALEYESRGKPSGISTTESDFYVYKINWDKSKSRKNKNPEYVIHRTSTIKDLVTKKKFHRIVNGGDKNSNTMNYLFRYDVFVNKGRIITLTKT